MRLRTSVCGRLRGRTYWCLRCRLVLRLRHYQCRRQETKQIRSLGAPSGTGGHFQRTTLSYTPSGTESAAYRQSKSRFTHGKLSADCPLQELGATAAARASGRHYARVGQEVPTDDTNLSPRLAGPRVPALYRQTRLCGEMPARRSRACVAGRLGRDSILWRCLFVGDDPRATKEAARLYTGGQAQRVPLR